MGRPILLLVNEQDRVLEALAGDLGRRFGAEYRILGERSPAAALATLQRLAAQSEEVALLIVAQQMREMAGVDFIVRAHELHPSAKRVLLVGRRAWTPTNPAVRAMTLGQIDDYLFEPWLPLGRWLYLPITQVLADWVPSQAPSFEGIRIVGPRWGSRAHELRDMLTRMGIPHGWYLADSQAGRELLQEAGQDGSRLPVVVFHSGRVFVDPSDAELAEGLGFGTRPAAAAYELVIVGAGPAGLAAAVYAASEGLQTLVVEPRVVGGQASVHLARYAASVTILCRDEALSHSMADYLVQQIERAPNVTVRLHTEVVDGQGGRRLEGLTLRDRRSGATQDVPAAALFVMIGAEPHTEWLAGTVERDDRGYILTGHDLLRAGRPPPGWPRQRPPLLLETSIPGVFAAGDVRYRSVKRVASAVGEGAVAVQLVHEYLAEQPS
jgi:thioredoxin reductase